MINLHLAPDESLPFRMLCLGAHPDDIEIGCGATILELLKRYPGSEVRWEVLSGSEDRKHEALASAETFLRNAGGGDVHVSAYKDAYFPAAYERIKDHFEYNVKSFEPSLIFTHCRTDAHQDHRVVSELTRSTFRNHLILEYEVAKYDGDLSRPSAYFPISAAIAREKIETIIGAFSSQREKHWFTKDAFWALLRIRGLECASSSGLAEAFHAPKWTIG